MDGDEGVEVRDCRCGDRSKWEEVLGGGEEVAVRGWRYGGWMCGCEGVGVMGWRYGG